MIFHKKLRFRVKRQEAIRGPPCLRDDVSTSPRSPESHLKGNNTRLTSLSSLKSEKSCRCLRVPVGDGCCLIAVVLETSPRESVFRTAEISEVDLSRQGKFARIIRYASEIKHVCRPPSVFLMDERLVIRVFDGDSTVSTARALVAQRSQYCTNE